MGNSPANYQFRADIFRTVEHHQKYKVIKHVKDSTQYRQYAFALKADYFDFKRELQLFQQRISKPMEHVVRVYHVETSGGIGCTQECGSDRAFRVITERVPFMLSEYKKLQIKKKLLLILEEVIHAYHIIFINWTNKFVVQKDTIGFDQDSRVRVWINSDFSKNSGEKVYSEQANEHALITNIFALIESCFGNGQFPSFFIHELEKLKPPLSFKETIVFLHNLSLTGEGPQSDRHKSFRKRTRKQSNQFTRNN